MANATRPRIVLAVMVLAFSGSFLHRAFVQAHSHSHSHSHDHSHSHSHDGHAHVDHEPASFRYSKRANEPDAAHSHHHAEGQGDHDPIDEDGSRIPNNAKHAKFDDDAQLNSNADSSSKKVQKVGKRKYEDPAGFGAQLWVRAIGSTVVISLVPFLILFIVPVDNTAEQEWLLKILLSFASGGLLGDAFLHLIPHAIMASDADQMAHGHSHDGGTDHEPHDMTVGLWVLAGIGAFLLVEKFVRLVKGNHSHGVSAHSYIGMAHSHVVAARGPSEASEQSTDAKNALDAGGDSPTKPTSTPREKSEEEVPQSKVEVERAEINVTGYLNLVADFIHNFTDGLAIGASYLAGNSVGFVTSVTILFHEVPHEIGDFAILIQSGCSRRKAMMLQLLTAVGAVSGTVVSLLAQGANEATSAWILPFTAGGFIYIATVSVIPEILQDTQIKQSIYEVIAILFGVGIMVLISIYE